MNLVDFLAILPYFISACLESLEDLHILGKAGKIMRLVRVMRILRIFKLVRHFAGLQSLLYTLKQVHHFFTNRYLVDLLNLFSGLQRIGPFGHFGGCCSAYLFKLSFLC